MISIELLKLIFFFSFYVSGVNKPYCNTPESYRHTEKIAENLFFYGQWNPNDCSCRQQCKKHLFTSSLESTTDRYKINKGRIMARVRVYYQVRWQKTFNLNALVISVKVILRFYFLSVYYKAKFFRNTYLLTWKTLQKSFICHYIEVLFSYWLSLPFEIFISFMRIVICYQ